MGNPPSSAPADLVAVLSDRYRVERELGAGGMATVYLAHDLRHDRQVALKVLRPELATVIGAERFLAEIRTTARLQHPNILPLLDSGAVPGTAFYTMPFVAGESLRQRIAREKQLPVADAVRIATEVADALDYAHRQGVIHRDIKPENILLHERRTMIADFGIALAVSRSDGAARMTETGLSLGTPQYMSPEQAMGEREIDGRADTYALGCVLHEMLVGEPPFTGASAQIIVAKAMTSDPEPVTVARKTVPRNVVAATLIALNKLPADRFATGAEFAAALANPAFRMASDRDAPRGESPRRAAAWVAGIAAVSAAIGASVTAVWRAPVRETTTERWDVVVPDSIAIDDPIISPPALSPDGTLLVFVARHDTSTSLYEVQLGTGRIRGLEGSHGARAPFFSPDGKSVGFLGGDQVRRLDLATGRVTVIREGVRDLLWATWTDGDRIAFHEFDGAGWMDANGTTVHRLPAIAPNTGLAALPGDRIVMQDPDENDYVVNLTDGSVRYLAIGDARSTPPPHAEAINGVFPRFVAPDFLVYWRPGTILYAVRFDPKTLRVLSRPVEVSRGVRAAVVGVSASGVLAYSPAVAVGATELVEAGPSGVMRTLPIPHRRFASFAPSPDGRNFAMRVMTENGRTAVVVYDVTEGRPQTKDHIDAGYSLGHLLWDPAGQYLYVDSLNGAVFRRDFRSGSLDSIAIPRKPDEVVDIAGLLGGDTLVANVGPATDRDAVLVPFSDRGKFLPYIGGPGNQSVADLSRDHRWVAYRSKTGNVGALFVAPLRDPQRALRIEGTSDPVRWGDDSQLYFVRGDSILRARVSMTGALPTMASPEFVTSASLLNQELPAYLPTSGRSVLLLKPSKPGEIRYLTVVRHWNAELSRAVRAATP